MTSTLLGTTVGKFRIERLLGEGGMGQVFLAIHPALGKKAAIKVLNFEYAQKPEVVRRFFNEARAAAALDHANIVEVYDFDTLPDGRPYMLLEFLEGETLAGRLKREKTLAPAAAAQIMAGVCAAVGAAHRHGIVHRDLKPDNIFLVQREGSHGLVKVLDFGIAKLLDDASASSVQTRGGMVLGTPEYMSPEQALGQNDRIGPASDVYSAGVIVHQMLIGAPVFSGTGLSFGQLLIQHVQQPPPPLRSLRPELSEGLERIVLKALAKNPAERWSSMEKLGHALEVAVDPTRADELRSLLAGTIDTPITHPQLAPATMLLADGGGKPTTLRSAAGSAHASGVMPGWRKLVPILAGLLAGGATLGVVAAILMGRHRAPLLPVVTPLAAPTATVSPARPSPPAPSALPVVPLTARPVAAQPAIAAPLPSSAAKSLATSVKEKPIAHEAPQPAPPTGPGASAIGTLDESPRAESHSSPSVHATHHSAGNGSAAPTSTKPVAGAIDPDAPLPQ